MDIESIIGNASKDISSLIAKLPPKERAQYNVISQGINKVLSGTKIDVNNMDASEIMDITKRQQEAINKINDGFTNNR